MIAIDKGDEEAVRAKAAAIADRLRKGEDFAKLQTPARKRRGATSAG